MLLHGCFRILLLFDVGEAIDLKILRDLLGPRGVQEKHDFPRRTPEYVRFEHPPVIESVQPVTLSTGEQMTCSVKYYAYAVVVVQFEVAFECDWNSLLSQASRLMDASEIEHHARGLVRLQLEGVASAIVRPTDQWLQEDYLVINIQKIRQGESARPTAAELLSAHSQEIAQLVRGERRVSTSLRQVLTEFIESFHLTSQVC